jgi:two-component system nitrogen regulation sensor histidine kinase GlnL
MPNLTASKILDYLNSSIICLSDRLTINQVNATAEVFFDTSEKTLLDRPFASLFDPKSENTILQSLEFCLLNNHQTTEHEALLTLANHRVITTDYSIHPITEDGHTSLLVEIQPIDRHMEIARDGQRINQQIASQQLARGMAHEIKNPLGGIRGAAQLLEGEITNPGLKEYTDVIIREVDRLQTLLNDMLGPNRRIVQTRMNILEVLEHVRSLILAEFPTTEVIRDYDPSIPEIMADKDQLIQAFLNMARNAAQAFVPLGAIQSSRIIFRTRICRQHTIGHRRYRHVMQIDIIDNGPGVADEVIDNIFLPMVTNKSDGSGLGLPIAQQIIFGHHGIIQCQSDQTQTTFTTLLPLEPAT